jgi:glycerol-3-phosphate acyltransferase PlsY
MDCGCFATIALTAVISHCYSIYIGFSGGKGVATAGGVLLALSPMIFTILIIGWLGILRLTSKPGIASVAAAIALIPLTSFISPDLFWTYMLIAIVVAHRHRENIEDYIDQRSDDNLPNRFFDE